jgi:hypothetical protein
MVIAVFVSDPAGLVAYFILGLKEAIRAARMFQFRISVGHQLLP